MERLPVVSKDVAAAVRAELVASKGNEYAIAILERLERENPELAQFIAIFAQTQEYAIGVATGAVVVYRLLESQMEADGMGKQFGV